MQTSQDESLYIIAIFGRETQRVRPVTGHTLVGSGRDGQFQMIGKNVEFGFVALL